MRLSSMRRDSVGGWSGSGPGPRRFRVGEDRAGWGLAGRPGNRSAAGELWREWSPKFALTRVCAGTGEGAGMRERAEHYTRENISRTQRL